MDINKNSFSRYLHLQQMEHIDLLELFVDMSKMES